MEIYINGTGIISPQEIIEEGNFSLDRLKSVKSNRLRCVEPDYKNYINPALLRRMSRMIKMGITASKICLEEAQVSLPGAIITGTGLGCIEDTEKFILSILDNNEQLLTPTPFIQSTHNTVGGQIALLLGCHEYNFTYVHRGISFESSLKDAIMLLQEKTTDNVLVGGIDELTDHSFKLLQQIGIYDRKQLSLSELNHGASGGEGAAFFLLTRNKTKQSSVKISYLKTFHFKGSTTDLARKIAGSISETGKKVEELPLVLLGDSGHHQTDEIYHELRKGIFKNSSTLNFKQYCGEYHTASSFALWLSVQLIKKANNESPASVLIYNHFGGEDHSIILVEKC